MLWQKRAVAKARNLNQRCSAGSTSFSQSRLCFSCEVQPSAEAWVVSTLKPDQISQFCLVKGALLDLTCVGGVKVQENQKIRTFPNYHKANWARFQEIVMESLTELAAEEVPSKKLFIFTEALKKAASMTTPLRVLRTNETPYMNDKIKCLMKETYPRTGFPPGRAPKCS